MRETLAREMSTNQLFRNCWSLPSHSRGSDMPHRPAARRIPRHSAPRSRRSPPPLSLLRPPRPRRWCVNAPDARTRGARDRFVRVARRVGFPARAIGSPRGKTRHAEGPRGVSRGFRGHAADAPRASPPTRSSPPRSSGVETRARDDSDRFRTPPSVPRRRRLSPSASSAPPTTATPRTSTSAGSWTSAPRTSPSPSASVP